MTDYLGPFEIVIGERKPRTRQPSQAEATALLDAVIRRTAQQKQTDYNGALRSLQAEAPELIHYFQSIRRI